MEKFNILNLINVTKSAKNEINNEFSIFIKRSTKDMNYKDVK